MLSFDAVRDVRTLILTAFGGLYGLALAIAANGLWTRPPSHAQLPGLLLSQGIDARVPFIDLAAAVLLVAAGCAGARALGHLLRESDVSVWYLAGGSLLLGAWSGIARPVKVASVFLPETLLRLVRDEVSLTLTLGIGLAGAVAAALLRRRALAFSSTDWILLPVFFSALFALTAIFPAASIQVLIVGAVLVTFLPRVLLQSRSSVTRAYVVPCATLPIHALRLQSAALPAAVLGVLLVWPFIASRFPRSSSRPGKRWSQFALAFVVYPLIAFSFPHTYSLTHAEGAPRADIFEDGHFLLPASEMARGERAFRDTIPQHGLLSDGLIEAIELRLGARDLGTLLRNRELMASLNVVAIYAVVFAATGSPHIAIAAFFASAALLLQGILFPRSTASLFALACAAAAIRFRSRRLLIAAGALIPLAILTSPDFGVVSLLTTVIACWAAGRGRTRLRAFAAAGIGVAVTGTVAWALLVACRVPLLTATARDVLSAGPAYGTGRLEIPANLTLSVPEAVGGLLSASSFPLVAWIVVLITSAALLVARRSRLTLPLALVGVWTILAAVNYAQRHQMFFRLTLLSFFVIAATLLVRQRLPQLRLLGGIVATVAIVAVQPTLYLTLVLLMRHAHGPIDTVQQWDGTPRARGALFRTEDIPRLETMKQAVATLRQGETFFDYANAPILFFLFDRDCPIRQTDVPFYEPARLQREVIRRLESRPIGFVVTSFGRNTTIDGITNEVRTPAVAAHVNEHFAAPVEKNGVALRFAAR